MKKLKIFDKLMLEDRDRATLEERFSEKSVLKDRFGDEKDSAKDGEKRLIDEDQEKCDQSSVLLTS